MAEDIFEDFQDKSDSTPSSSARLTRPKAPRPRYSLDTTPCSKTCRENYLSSRAEEFLQDLLRRAAVREHPVGCHSNLLDCPVLKKYEESLKKGVTNYMIKRHSENFKCEETEILNKTDDTKLKNLNAKLDSLKILNDQEETEMEKFKEDSKLNLRSKSTNTLAVSTRTNRAHELRSLSNKHLLRPKGEKQISPLSPYKIGLSAKSEQTYTKSNPELGDDKNSSRLPKLVSRQRTFSRGNSECSSPTITERKVPNTSIGKKPNRSIDEVLKIGRAKTSDDARLIKYDDKPTPTKKYVETEHKPILPRRIPSKTSIPSVVARRKETKRKNCLGEGMFSNMDKTLQKSKTFFVCEGPRMGQGDDKDQKCPKIRYKNKYDEYLSESEYEDDEEGDDIPPPRPLTHNDSFCLISRKCRDWSQKEEKDERGILKQRGMKNLKDIDSLEKFEGEKIVRFLDTQNRLVKKATRRKLRQNKDVCPPKTQFSYRTNKLFQKQIQHLKQRSVLLKDLDDEDTSGSCYLQERYEAEMLGLVPRSIGKTQKFLDR